MVKKTTKPAANDSGPPIWERIKMARISRGMTQQELSMATGMTVTAISGLENVRRPTPRIDTIQRLSDALGTNLLETAVRQEVPSSKVLNSLDKFLSSEMARALHIKKDEAIELRALRFFSNGDKIQDIDWVDWLRLRRRVKKQSK